MWDETLKKIEDRLRLSSTLGEPQRAELLRLMQDLKSEVHSLADSDPDHAHSIASFADLSTHEATRGERQPALLQHAVGGLSSSVTGFEQAHPKLTEAVNRLAVLLSNMGV